MTDYDMRFLALQRRLDELYDDQVRQRRMLTDLLYNLDEENMPAVKELIERYKAEDGEAIAALRLNADESFAAIESIAEVQTAHGSSIASVEQKATRNASSISELTALQTQQGKSIASVEQQAEANTASIESLAAVQTEQGESIASVRRLAEENAASIESVAATQTEQGESIAKIEQNASSLGAEISIAVEKANSAESAANAAESTASAAESVASAAESVASAAESVASAAQSTASEAQSTASEANEKVSNGAYIIARVNEDGSLVKIKADKLELSGYATFNSLKTAGATVIDGANLKTGTVTADSIALNSNGQINLEKLGSLSFLDPSGASGEVKMFENEFGRGEINVISDGTVAIDAGEASFMLLDSGSGTTEASLYADLLRINGTRAISGTFSLGTGSISVVNGIVVGVTEGSGGGNEGGGNGSEITLQAPTVLLDEAGGFLISNPNGVGTIAYYSYWYDDYGNSGDSSVSYSSGSSVSGYVFAYPENGGYIGVSAWIEYDDKTSPGAVEETSYA